MITEDELSALFSAKDDPQDVQIATSPTPGLSMPDKLRFNASLALDRQRELLELGVDPTDHRQNRLVADVAQATVKAAMQLDVNLADQKRDGIISQLMDMMVVEQARCCQPGEPLDAEKLARLPGALERLREPVSPEFDRFLMVR